MLAGMKGPSRRDAQTRDRIVDGGYLRSKVEGRADRLEAQCQVASVPWRHSPPAIREPEQRTGIMLGVPTQPDAIAFGRVPQRRLTLHGEQLHQLLGRLRQGDLSDI